jgi:hypothetical protein
VLSPWGLLKKSSPSQQMGRQWQRADTKLKCAVMKRDGNWGVEFGWMLCLFVLFMFIVVVAGGTIQRAGASSACMLHLAGI